MSTNPDSQKQSTDQSNRFDDMKRKLPPGEARSAAEAELENSLAGERDGRREDRFLFAVALIVIFDIWAMHDVDTWTVPVVVGVIELFFLLIFARRMGVEEIHFWLNQLLPHFKVGIKKPEESATTDTHADASPRQGQPPQNKDPRAEPRD
ncbi:hypothetical protein [Salinicola sp. CPA57]|uniref:hypothetical protein n=1 Tax=Salinicola sp. CPA57 TaxID=1949080 RepID=UPI00130075F5|nr:hypothetical protein [Salinicola sp. CPA57]